jgi:hypothetical protein
MGKVAVSRKSVSAAAERLTPAERRVASLAERLEKERGVLRWWREMVLKYILVLGQDDVRLRDARDGFEGIAHCVRRIRRLKYDLRRARAKL